MLDGFIRRMEENILDGGSIYKDEALTLMGAEGPDLISLFASANRLRGHFKGNRVKFCSISNAKSGLCSEDCTFCAQSTKFKTEIKIYPLESEEKIISDARAAKGYGAREFSIVLSGKGTKKPKEIDSLARMIQGVRELGRGAVGQQVVMLVSKVQRADHPSRDERVDTNGA